MYDILYLNNILSITLIIVEGHGRNFPANIVLIVVYFKVYLRYKARIVIITILAAKERHQTSLFFIKVTKILKFQNSKVVLVPF